MEMYRRIGQIFTMMRVKALDSLKRVGEAWSTEANEWSCFRGVCFHGEDSG
jgi:hypothetical protein